MSLLLSPSRFLLIRFDIFLTLSSVSFGASLEDDIAGIVGELRVLVDAVDVHAVIMLNFSMLYELFLLIFGPVHAALGSARHDCLLILPCAVHGSLVGVLKNSPTFYCRIDSVFYDDDCVGAVQPQFLSILISVLVDVVRCDVEHSAEPSQLIGVIAQLHHVVFHKVEHILVVDVKVQVEEERVVEDGRDDVLDDAVGAVDD